MLFLTSALLALAAPASVPEDPTVCRRTTDFSVGTNIRPKKVCMKKSEWLAQESDTQREFRQINELRPIRPEGLDANARDDHAIKLRGPGQAGGPQ